jgi:hypothetical protein
MEEYFAALPITNRSVLCVGGITSEEAVHATSAGVETDGFGYYLFLADQQNLTKPIELLAKFANPAAAERVARLIASSGRGA